MIFLSLDLGFAGLVAFLVGNLEDRAGVGAGGQVGVAGQPAGLEAGGGGCPVGASGGELLVAELDVELAVGDVDLDRCRRR